MSWYYLQGGQQVGPISWEDLFRAAQARAFGPRDMVWGPGLATWQPAGSIPGLFTPPVAAEPAPAPGRPMGSGPAPGPQTAARAARPVGDDPVMRMLLPVGRSPWAIAAGYLGLFSLLLLPAPFAVATGLLALHDIRSDPAKHGKGRAIFGIVLGTIGTLALVAFTIALILERS
ncbi:MAG TPA: GYF domain-containing protein [Thermoanaerobaculia bacterium]|nr:GYF domain-containing protein [Thermoanaerobaculia bacterium]